MTMRVIPKSVRIDLDGDELDAFRAELVDALEELGKEGSVFYDVAGLDRCFPRLVELRELLGEEQ
jgi:hypothetical protein